MNAADRAANAAGGSDLAGPPQADRHLDAIGLSCATLTPEIRTEVMALEPGHLLEILTDDPSAEEALGSWTRLTGNELIGRGPAAGEASRYYIRRNPAPIPAGTPHGGRI